MRYKGTSGHDTFIGEDQDDIMRGFGGDDGLAGRGGNDRLFGGDGNDDLVGGAGTDFLDGGAGIDTVELGDPNSKHGGHIDLSQHMVLDDGFGTQDFLKKIENAGGTLFDDIIVGSDGRNELFGSSGDDTLSGGGRDDYLIGADGHDILIGGAGADHLWGGADGDTFKFVRDDLTHGDPETVADRITDFSHQGGDIVDLSAIDAKAGGDDDAFKFIGTNAFSGHAGELRVETIDHHMFVFADVDGDKIADLTIKFQHQIALTEADFVL